MTRLALHLAALLLPAAPLVGDEAPAGVSNCCTPHVGGGCDDPVCSETVIDFDFECFFAWDSVCVGWAEDMCGSLCGGSGGCPGTGDCCTVHPTNGCSDPLCCDLVCIEDPSCCDSGWGGACVELATILCEVCEPPIECPMQGDCCGYNFTPGCDRKYCCEIVCIELGDEFCCRGKWDDVCARKARENCPNVCSCADFGDMNEDGGIDLRDVAAFQNCFSGNAAVDDACACGDWDADDHIDLADYEVLHGLLAAP